MSLSSDRFLTCPRWITYPSWISYYLHQLRHVPISTLGRLFKTVVVIAVLGGAILIGPTLLTGGLMDGDPQFELPAPAAPNSTDRTTISVTEPEAGGSTVTVPERTTRTGSPSRTTDAESPWDTETVVVGVRNQAAPSRNISGAVAAALEYWETNAEYGAYTTEFALEPNATHPDIIVWYNETVDCAVGSAGCAPLLNGTYEARPPENVQIRYDESDNYRQVKNTLIHEFGHVLGITHCEEPHWIMSYWSSAHGCANPTFEGPNVEDRALAWRDSNLSVYLDYSGVAEADLMETKSQVDHALAYFEDGRAEEFPANVSFTRVQHRWKADIVITVTQETDCRGDTPVCIHRWGRDYDGDGANEYYTRAMIVVQPDVDTDARGWYVGWGLAHQLSPGHIPPVFEEASYGERRSDWWN